MPLVGFELEAVTNGTSWGLEDGRLVFHGNDLLLPTPKGDPRDVWVLQWEATGTELYVDKETREPYGFSPGSNLSLLGYTRFAATTVYAYSWLLPWKMDPSTFDEANPQRVVFLGHDLVVERSSPTQWTARMQAIDGDETPEVQFDIRLSPDGRIATLVRQRYVVDEEATQWETTWEVQDLHVLDVVDPGFGTPASLSPEEAHDPVRQPWKGAPPEREAGPSPFPLREALSYAQEGSQEVAAFFEANPNFWIQRAEYRFRSAMEPGDLVRAWTVTVVGDGEDIEFKIERYGADRTPHLTGVHLTFVTDRGVALDAPDEFGQPEMITLDWIFQQCGNGSGWITYHADEPFEPPFTVGGRVQWPESSYLCGVDWRIDAVTGQYLYYPK